MFVCSYTLWHVCRAQRDYLTLSLSQLCLLEMESRNWPPLLHEGTVPVLRLRRTLTPTWDWSYHRVGLGAVPLLQLVGIGLLLPPQAQCRSLFYRANSRTKVETDQLTSHSPRRNSTRVVVANANSRPATATESITPDLPPSSPCPYSVGSG